MLSPHAIKNFYDRFGSRQDRQAFYEDRALDILVEQGKFAEARFMIEFGCGTGRLADRLLTTFPALTYQGFDVSSTMANLATRRLAAFGKRSSVSQLQLGTIRLPVRDHSADRLISTYVLDLLPVSDIEAFFGEALRVLRPGGLLCLSSLTNGPTLLSGIVSHLWSTLFRIRPQAVGGCRPIDLESFHKAADWQLEHDSKSIQWGIPSEVMVLRAHAA